MDLLCERRFSACRSSPLPGHGGVGPAGTRSEAEGTGSVEIRLKCQRHFNRIFTRAPVREAAEASRRPPTLEAGGKPPYNGKASGKPFLRERQFRDAAPRPPRACRKRRASVRGCGALVSASEAEPPEARSAEGERGRGRAARRERAVPTAERSAPHASGGGLESRSVRGSADGRRGSRGVRPTETHTGRPRSSHSGRSSSAGASGRASRADGRRVGVGGRADPQTLKISTFHAVSGALIYSGTSSQMIASLGAGRSGNSSGQ
jgi:hypothetical protein